MTNDELRITPICQGIWWKELAILVPVCGLFIFWGLGSFSFLDPDEGMYGAIAREMAERGDWITSRFNGVRYLSKPPLHFWLSGLSVIAFGPSEWSVRLWSAVPAFATALLIWRMGVWLYGRLGGCIAALIFATSIGVFVYARVAAPDFLLVFSITLAMYGFIKAVLSAGVAEGGRGLRNHASRLTCSLVFYLGMASGVLSKGLIGLVFPLLIVGLFLLLANARWQMANRIRGVVTPTIRNSLFAAYSLLFASRYAVFGVLVFLALTLPWHIIAALRNPGFFEFYVVDNQILRFLNTRGFIEDDVQNGTLSFLVVTLIWFFPWSLFLPAALRQGFPRFHHNIPLNETLRLLVGVWALGILAFFSLSLSKLEYYSMPAFPALSLMVGGRWAEALSWPKSQTGFKLWFGVLALGCLLFGGAIIFFSDGLGRQVILNGFAEINGYYRILKEQGIPFPFDSLSPFIEFLKGVGLVVALGFSLSYILFFLRLPKVSFTTLLMVAGAIAFLVFKLNLVLESHHSTKPVASALLTMSGPSDMVVHEGPLEYSGGLPFYTGRRISVLNGSRGSLDFGSRYPEARYLFLDNRRFIDLWGGNLRVFLVTRPGVQESVLQSLPSEKIFLVGRYGSRWLYTNKSTVNGQQLTVDGQR